MADKTLGVVESKFADIIWNGEPLSSSELSRLAEKELGWKESTSYTILKRLCQRGLFQNVNRTVTSLVTKEEFYALQSEKFVEETFQGSLPAFMAAFTSRASLTPQEVAEIRKLIDVYGEEK